MYGSAQLWRRQASKQQYDRSRDLGGCRNYSKEQADRPPTPTKAGSLRRAPPLHSAAAGRRMASPDRASRNLQLSQNRTSLAFRFLFQAQPAARPLASWTPGTRWHPKRAAGLPPGARAAAAEPAARSLGTH